MSCRAQIDVCACSTGDKADTGGVDKDVVPGPSNQSVGAATADQYVVAAAALDCFCGWRTHQDFVIGVGPQSRIKISSVTVAVPPPLIPPDAV